MCQVLDESPLKMTSAFSAVLAPYIYCRPLHYQPMSHEPPSRADPVCGIWKDPGGVPRFLKPGIRIVTNFGILHFDLGRRDFSLHHGAEFYGVAY